MSDIKIQPSATGSATVTLTAPATSTARTVTLPDSTGTLVDNTTAVTKDASGNVGIGVTPETDIPSLYKALQINGAGSIYAKESGTDCRLHLSSNASMNSSYDDKYIKSSVNSSTYIQSAGTHTFQTAASGSADAAITWTTGFEVLNDGKARAKNGLLFGTDTAAANALDDYEEGTWTVGLQGANQSGMNTTGYYTKIGRQVFFQWYSAAMTISSASGSARVTGLPFTSSTASNAYGLFIYLHGNAVDGASTGGYVQDANTYFRFVDTNSVSDASYVDGSGKYIMVSGSYFVS